MDLKNEIIEITQKMCRDNLVLGTWGNVSARAGMDSMWITPSGMNYAELGPDDLVLLSFDGKTLEGHWKPSSEWRLHAAMYRARNDVNGIVHTHSVYATAYAIARVPIPPVVEDFAQVVGGHVGVADYACLGTEELAENAVLALGDRSAVLLASHGVVGVAGCLAEAFKVCSVVEKTAQATLMARLLGPVHELHEDDVRGMRSAYLTSYGPESCEEELK